MPHPPPVITPRLDNDTWNVVRYWTGETEIIRAGTLPEEAPPSMRVRRHHHVCPNCDTVFVCDHICFGKDDLFLECESCYADRENEHDPDECEDSDCDICNG